MKLTQTSRHHPLHHRRRTIALPLGTQRFLAAFEGLEGGFAIGTSIVIALSFADLSREVLLLTAIIGIVVSGFNNASVKYSSEHYLDELDGREKRSAVRTYFVPALIEFISYLVISFVAVLPLIFIASTALAISISVVLTLGILFVAGYWRAYMLQMPRLRDGLELTLLGGGILLVGLISGYITSIIV